MFLRIGTPIIWLHKPSRDFDTHNIVQERDFIILVQIPIMIFILGLVTKASCLGWLSMVNMTRIFTPRLPRIYMLLLSRSNITLEVLFILISSSLVLMWLISTMNSVILALMTSFVNNSLHCKQIPFQLLNTLSLFLHHRNNFFIWDGILGNSFHFWHQNVPRQWLHSLDHEPLCIPVDNGWTWLWKRLWKKQLKESSHRQCQYSEMGHRIPGIGSSKLKLGLLRLLLTVVIDERVEFHGRTIGGTCKDFDNQVSQSKR